MNSQDLSPFLLAAIHSNNLRLLKANLKYKMRLTALPFLFLAPYVSAYNQQKPLQIYLHPTPTNPSSQSAPTLTADQAKAVLSHHLGENIGDFEEIPSDEGLWGHLVSMWNGEESGAGEGRKAKVVVIEGGVMPQG